MGIDAMANYKRKDYNIRIDGDNPDFILRKNMKELRTDQLNRKINVLFLIIFILICVLLAVAYFEIKGRTSDKHAEKTEKIEKALNDMASQYSGLSDKISKIQDSVSNQLAVLQKSNAGFKADLTEVEKNLNVLSSSKIGKHELKQIAAQIDKSVAPYQDKINNNLSLIKQLDKNVKQELFLLADALDKFKISNSDLFQTVTKESERLTGLNQTVASYQKNLSEIQETTLQQQGNLNRLIETFEDEKGEWAKLSKLIIQRNKQPIELPDTIKRSIQEIDQLHAELVIMAKSVVYKKMLDSAIARNLKENKQNLDSLERNLRKRITALQKEFLKFEKKISSSIILPRSDSTRPTKRNQTSDQSSGTIFEQDIQ